jgi:hypothetical protein
MDDILINFLNLEKPTTLQIIETLKILIKQNLKITDDGYSVNPLTGEKSEKITTKPTQIDLVTDEDIIKDIVKIDLDIVKEELKTTKEELETAKDDIAKLKKDKSGKG